MRCYWSDPQSKLLQQSFKIATFETWVIFHELQIATICTKSQRHARSRIIGKYLLVSRRNRRVSHWHVLSTYLIVQDSACRWNWFFSLNIIPVRWLFANEVGHNCFWEMMKDEKEKPVCVHPRAGIQGGGVHLLFSLYCPLKKKKQFIYNVNLTPVLFDKSTPVTNSPRASLP